MDLNPGWEGLAAAADEDERIFRSRRCGEIARLAQADLVEIEDVGEECAELGIVPDTVLDENEGVALAVERRRRDYLDVADFSPPSGCVPGNPLSSPQSRGRNPPGGNAVQ